MRRKLNVKLLAIVFGTLAVLAVGGHFLQGYQLQQNAYRLLERADRSFEAKEYDKAMTYYNQYLVLVPNDPDTMQKFAQALDAQATSVAERVRLILLMEQVLRAKPGEQELRLRLIYNLIKLERIAEAIANLRTLQRDGYDKALVLHMLGWCQEAKKDYPAAVRSFEEAIKHRPTQIDSYALLATVYEERLTQPEEAQRVMDELVQANAKSYQAYLLRFAFHRRRGDEKSAHHDLDSAYKLAPDRPEVILAVADAARVKGDWAEATRLLQDGLKRFPEQADLWKELIWIKIRAEERDEAIVFAKDGLRNLPKSTDLAILLIELLIDQKQYAEAQTKIDELRKAGLRTTLPNYLQARIKVAHQEWSEAIPLLEEIRRELGPKSEWSARVDVLLGLSYRQTGDHEQELQAFRRAAAAEPDWAVAKIGLGAALLSVGRIEEANQTLEAFRSAKNIPSGYWILLSRSRLARQLRLREADRRWDEVEQALARADQADSKNPAVPIVRADLLAAQGKFAETRALLEKLRGTHPNDVVVWCAMADLSARQDRFDEAEALLEKAIATLGDRLELRLAQCRLWGQRGTDQARAKLARLGDDMPKSYSRLERALLSRTLADTWHHLGDTPRAETLWRAVARAYPSDLRSRSMLLDTALEKQQPLQAQGWIDDIRTIEGEEGWLWRYGAIALQIQEAHGRRRQLDDARKNLKDLEKQHKNWSRVPVLAANLFEVEGRFQQAIQEYTRAVDLGELQPRTLNRLLTLLLERREFGKAESALSKYEQNAPLTRDLARLGAEIALGVRDKRFAKLAVTRAEQAVALPARDYRDLLWLARIYQAVGDAALAEARLREALQQAPHAPDTWIAWMDHLAHTNQRALADQELERMRAELPAGRHALTLARCFEALRDADRAAKAYHGALQARPDDFITLAYAADFYRRSDQAAEAISLYQRLLDPVRVVPAEYAVPARRHLAVLLASPNAAARKQALDLLDINKQTRGTTLADERVRLYVQSLASATARQNAVNRFHESLRVEQPTPDERVLLARMLESSDLLMQARDQLTDAVEESATPQFLTRQVQLLIRTEELDEAERQFTRLQAMEPTSARVRDLRKALDRAKTP